MYLCSKNFHSRKIPLIMRVTQDLQTINVDPRSQFSRSINVVFFTAHVRRHGYHFGHDIIYNSTEAFCIFALQKIYRILTRKVSLSHLEHEFSRGYWTDVLFPRLWKQRGLLPRHTMNARQSFSINLQQIRLGNDYEEVTIFKKIMVVKNLPLPHYHMNGPSILRFMFTESSKAAETRNFFYNPRL